MTQERYLSLLLRSIIVFLSSYGMLYYAYKYNTPTYGAVDFVNYYDMYRHPMDFSIGRAPFIYRQISAILVNSAYNLGIYYNSIINFNDPKYEQRIFFAALFVNYFCLMITAIVVGSIVERCLNKPSIVLPTLAGLFCLLAFPSQTYVVTGMTEGVSWMFFTLILFFYLREENRIWLGALLLLSIWQRELIAISFGAIAFFSIVLGRGARGYQIFVLVLSGISFAAYVALRTLLLPIAGHEEQVNLNNLAGTLLSFWPTKEFIFQGLLSQSIVFLCLVLCFASFVTTRYLPKTFVALALTDVVLAVIGISAGIGNNVGRVSSILTPAFAVVAAMTIWRIELFLSGDAAKTPTAAELA